LDDGAFGNAGGYLGTLPLIRRQLIFVVRHRDMKKIAAIIILCFLPFGAYALTDQEVLDLLSQSSKEIEKFPFHVYVAPGYGGFHGTALPISSYGFFEPFYEELKYEQPDEIFSTYQFSQGHRWKCFL